MFIDVHVEALIMRAFVARRQLQLLLFLYLFPLHPISSPSLCGWFLVSIRLTDRLIVGLLDLLK